MTRSRVDGSMNGAAREVGARASRSIADKIYALRQRCAELETTGRSLRRDVHARPVAGELPIDRKTCIIRKADLRDAESGSGPASGIVVSDGERPLHLAFEASPFAQCFIDAAGMICDVNRAALRLLAVTPGDCIGRNLSELVADVDAASSRVSWSACSSVRGRTEHSWTCSSGTGAGRCAWR
jgi:PAS domain-containing protein